MAHLHSNKHHLLPTNCFCSYAMAIDARFMRHVRFPWIRSGVMWCCESYAVSGYIMFPQNGDLDSSQWRHNERDGVSNHQPHDCLLKRLFRHLWKKTSKLRVTGLCEGNSLAIGEVPAQRASNAENASIWWRHHVCSGRVYNVSTKWRRWRPRLCHIS